MSWWYDDNFYDTYEEAEEAALSDSIIETDIVFHRFAQENAASILEWAMDQPGFWDRFSDEWDDVRRDVLESFITEVDDEEDEGE